MTRWYLPLAFATIALFLLSGCCSYFTDILKNNQANGTTILNQTLVNHPPIVNLTLNSTSGPTPFSPYYMYLCYDPDNNLVSCELKIDGRTYAKGNNQSTIFPEGYEHPDFYWDATKALGNHTLEIFAVDSKGLNASKTVTFTVLEGLPLLEPGWYSCNEKKDYPPCNYMYAYYCDKITPQDMAVREAASAAISKHPGAFSINQLLDIYDWVHTNVFYQNVPIDMWPPYPPNETLRTKSGDCKNQAVLIASMVEAIGGSARVLYIPECRHAFTEVYLGDNDAANTLSQAMWAHYSGRITDEQYSSIRWHNSKNAKNETESWFIFDTAGGWFPGNTIPECLDASRTYYLLDCNRDPDELNAPEVEGTAYGPYTRINETQVLSPGWEYHYGVDPWIANIPDFKWCHYDLTIESLSPNPVDWYVMDEEGYQGFINWEAFRYYYGEEQVQKGEQEFDWSTPDRFYVGMRNNDESSSITVRTQLLETCYK